MPLATYIALESDPGAALILSIVLIVVSFGVLVALRDRWLGNPHEVTRP
jgi:molybdate transport system permease protein